MKEITDFLERTTAVLQEDGNIIGLCAGGSMLTNDMDRFSDLDLIVVSETVIHDSKEEMVRIAARLGEMVAAFTGEHLGEPRVLICLYDKPVLHVDLKFLQKKEFEERVEDPVVIWERRGGLTAIIERTTANWPAPGFQWLEDRFWVWIHYTAAKLDRGELFEAIDALSYMRSVVLGPLFHIKYGNRPRGVRKMEFILDRNHLNKLKRTIPDYTFVSVKKAVVETVVLYRELRAELFGQDIRTLTDAERVSTAYLEQVADGS